MAEGTIKPGGDPRGYLGHFRNPEVIKKGHNFGAPGTSMPKAGGGPSYGYKPKPRPTMETGGGFGTPTPPIADDGGMAPKIAAPGAATGARALLGIGEGSKKMTPRAEKKAARKSAFGAIKAQKKEVNRFGRGMGDVRKVERTKLQGMKKEAKKEFPKAYAARMAPKPKKEEGGFLSKLVDIGKKSTGVPAMKKAGGKMAGAAKKMGKKMAGGMKKTVPGA